VERERFTSFPVRPTPHTLVEDLRLYLAARRSVDRVSRGRDSRREAKCQSAFYSRVIEWGSHGTRTGSFVTTLLMRAGSYAKRITKTPARTRHKLHDLRISVAYRRIHFGTHAARWLRAPSPKLHATQPSPRGALGEKLSRRDRERRNVCPSALLADTDSIRLAGCRWDAIRFVHDKT